MGIAIYFQKNKKFLKKCLHFSGKFAIISKRLLRRSLLSNRWEVQSMAKCDFCGKGVTFGIKVSHSHRRSNRAWKPNVKRVKAVVNGTPCHVYACTRCLRSNKVERAI